MSYKEQYLEQELEKVNPTQKPLFAVGLIGVTGSGKSTVAETLGSRLHLYVTRNDRIRRFLNTVGFAGAHPQQLLVQDIAESLTYSLYAKGVSHLMDQDLVQFYKKATEIAQEYGVRLFMVQIVCSEPVLLSRLRQRDAKGPEGDHDSLAQEALYWKRKPLHERLPLDLKIDYTIDTSKDLNSQVEQFVEYLQKQGVSV